MLYVYIYCACYTNFLYSLHFFFCFCFCHLNIQIWVSPSKSRLNPSYSTGYYPDSAKLNQLCHIIKSEKAYTEADAEAETSRVSTSSNEVESRKTSKPIKINQDLNMFASILSKDSKIPFTVEKNRKAYIHVIEGNGSLSVFTPDSETPEILKGGDGAFIRVSNTTHFELVGSSDKPVEFLLFEMVAH